MNICILTICLMLELTAYANPEEKALLSMLLKHGSLCSSRFCKAEEEECFSKENLLRSLNYDMAAKKRKKDLMNNNSKVPCESETPSKDHCFHISEGRTHAKHYTKLRLCTNTP